MTSTTILIGMDFLRRFDRALIISNKMGVVLVDEPSDSKPENP